MLVGSFVIDDCAFDAALGVMIMMIVQKLIEMKMGAGVGTLMLALY